MRSLTNRSLTFSDGIPALLLVLVLASLEAIGSRVFAYTWTVGPTLPLVETNAVAAAVSISVLVAVWMVLTREGVTPTDIGLSREFIVPATVAVAGYFLALNLVGAGLAVASGHADTIGYQWTVPPLEAVVFFLWMLLVAGLVEEVIFRGYIQTKCVALLGDGTRVRVGAGIVLAGALFAASHIPRVIVGGTPSGLGPTAYLGLLVVNGIAFGVLYEGTHNLYVPVLVHAAGNMPGTAGVLFFTTAGWPPWASTGYQIAYLGFTVGMLLAYRRWAFGAGWMPVWSVRTAERSIA
jgi:membrane protease YdiL (CAAX protease family)